MDIPKSFIILGLVLCMAVSLGPHSAAQEPKPENPNSDNLSAALELHFGGPGTDGAHSIVPLSDGGFALGGWKTREDQTKITESWVLRLDRRGRYTWDLPLPKSAPYGVSAMSPAFDGGLFTIDGETNNHQGKTRLTKISPDGLIEQQQIYGFSPTDQLAVVRPTLDGGLVMAGHAYPTGDKSNGWVVKLDRDLAVQWFRMISGPVTGDTDQALEDIIVLADGNFIAVGWMTDDQDHSQGWVIRLSPGGNTLSQDTHELGPNTEFHKVLAAPNNALVVAATTSTNSRLGRKVVLAGLSENGDLTWRRAIASEGTALATGISRLDRTSYYLSVSIEDEAGQAGLVVSFSSEGELNGIQRHNSGSIHRALTVTATADFGYAVAGSSKRTNSLDQDMWLLIAPGGPLKRSNRPAVAP